MAGYIGTIPVPQATESRSVYTATSNQTTFATGGYTPNLVSVFLNGVHLARADFAATNGTDVVLAAGAAADDTVEIIAFNAFEASSSTFTGDVIASGGTLQASGDTAAGDDAAIGYTAAEGLILTGQGSTSDITLKNDADAVVFTVPTGTDDILFPDNAKALFGAGSDLQIYHNGSNSYVSEEGTGDLLIRGSSNIYLAKSDGSETYARFEADGAASLYHNNAVKLATTATGITVTGAIATSAGGVALTSLDIDGGTDIGAALVDADLMIVDDGAGGTNRKATMTRLATYMGTKIGGGYEFLASTGAIDDAGTATFTQFDASKYDSYEFKFIDIVPATDGAILQALTSSDTSSHSFDTGSADYFVTLNSNTKGAFGKVHVSGFGNATNEQANLSVFVQNPHTAKYTTVSSYAGSIFLAAGYPEPLVSQGFIRAETAQVNAIRFFMSAGNITTGEIVMYGIVNGS